MEQTITYDQAAAKMRLFIGIQGPPGEGKTTSALTFPNPVLASFDDNLPNKDTLQELGVDTSKIQIVPWTDVKWVDEYHMKTMKERQARSFFQGIKGPPNVKDAFTHWLDNAAMKLPDDATLIIDSWTALHMAFDRERSFIAPFIDISPTTGKFDPRPFWGDKLKYSKDVMDRLKNVPCSVIVIYHEKKQYDEKTGQLVDKIAPLQEGQFINQIPRFYADYYRQTAKPKLDANGKPIKYPDGKAVAVDYWWQIKSDDVCTCRSRLRTDKSVVPATYQSLIEYGLVTQTVTKPPIQE